MYLQHICSVILYIVPDTSIFDLAARLAAQTPDVIYSLLVIIHLVQYYVDGNIFQYDKNV